MKSSVQHIIEDFSHLPLEDREYVVDIVKNSSLMPEEMQSPGVQRWPRPILKREP